MTLFDHHEQEQREARIQAAFIEASERFNADMREINAKHRKRISRIDYWSAFTQGAVVGAAVAVVAVVIVCVVTVHK